MAYPFGFGKGGPSSPFMPKNLKRITGFGDLHLARSMRMRNLAWVMKTLTLKG